MAFELAAFHNRRLGTRTGKGKSAKKLQARLSQRFSRVPGIFKSLLDRFGLCHKLGVKRRGDNVTPFFGRLQIQDELSIGDCVTTSGFHADSMPKSTVPVPRNEHLRSADSIRRRRVWRYRTPVSQAGVPASAGERMLLSRLKAELQPTHTATASTCCPATISAHCSGVYSTSRACEPL
jgi:hypothetical protein